MRMMDDDFLNNLFASNKLKLLEKERTANIEANREITYFREVYKKAREYARELNDVELEKIANTSDNTHSSIGLKNLEKPAGISPALPIRLGVLIEAGYAGFSGLAHNFGGWVRQNNTVNRYVENNEIEDMHRASILFSSTNQKIEDTFFAVYTPNTSPIDEQLILKLSHRLERGEPEAFFAMAQACLKGMGTNLDVNKAYKLLTIAAGMGHIEAKKQMQVLETMFPVLVAAQPTLEVDAVGLSTKIHEISKNDAIQIETKIQENGVPSSVMTRTSLYSTPAINPERICLAMMKDAPHCTVIAVASGTAEDWITSLPSPCHLLFETLVPKENNTVLRCLRLLEANGYPANSGELCAAPPHIAMESLMVATYQLGFERGPLVV
jgi:TPR repeat protein